MVRERGSVIPSLGQRRLIWNSLHNREREREKDKEKSVSVPNLSN
jgi:hypothetical protein